MASSTKRKEKTFSPLNSSDKPDTILTKLKSISDFTSDININPETLNKEKESQKQILALLENLTQKFLVDSVDDHPQLKLILSCCLVDLVRILGPHNPQILNKSQFIISMVNETFLSSDKLTESHYLPQFHYLLQNFDKSQGHLLLGIEKLWELSKTFVSACFEVVDALHNQPEIYSRVQQILGNVLESVRSTAKEDIAEEIVLPVLTTFDKSNKKTKKIELAKAVLKEMSWNLRQMCGKVCQDIFRRRGIYRTITPSLSVEQVCYMIQNLFKIDYEIILPLWPYLENDINVNTKKETRKTYLTLLGKICASKLSHVSTTCPQIFNNFSETLTSKKNKPFRQDLLGLAFKYIRNFTYCKTVSNHEIQTSSVKYDVYKTNLNKLEGKIKEILYETDDENKTYILERIKTLSLENPKFISQDLLRDVSTLLWFEKEKKKENILDLLSDLYIQYCCTLFDEDIYDFDSLSGNYALVNGFLDSRTRQRKEAAKNYLWIAETLILFFHHNTTKAFGILQTALNKVLGLHTLTNKGVVKRMLGFYYNLWMKKYDKEPTKEDVNDQKSIRYIDFIQKKLKYNWFTEKEILSPDFFFLMRGIAKIFKICNLLHQNFAEYLRALREDKPSNAQECRNYILTHYHTLNTSFDQIEKEIKNALERDDFKNDIDTLIDAEHSFSSKQEVLTKLVRNADNKGLKFLFENLGINLFNEHVTEKLISLTSSIIQRDSDHRIFIQEGSLEFIIYLTKRNFHPQFKTDLAELVSYLSENIEIVILKARRTDPSKVEELRETQSTNSYVASCLKLLSLLNLNEIDARHNVELEELKYYLSDRLSKLELPSKQAKYAARIVHNLDAVTSETIGVKVVEKLLPHLELKSPVLLSTLRALEELLKNNHEAFMYHMDDLNQFLNELVRQPVGLEREHLISELSQCKKVLIKTLYNCYHNNDIEIGNVTFKRNAVDFKAFLLQLLLNFNDFCAGFMISDKDYLRIHILDYYLEILAKESFAEIDAESFAKLSLLCYDDNDDIKKYLFSSVFFKRTRRHTQLNHMYFLYSFFLCFAEDRNLKLLAEDNFFKELDNIYKNYVDYMEKTKTEDATRSAEYMIVYLIFLMCNNPLLLLDVKALSYHFRKCLDHFASILGKTKNPRKEEYLMEILHTLRNYNPVVFKECATTRIDFTDIKARKMVSKKPLKKGDTKESQSQTILTFQEIIDEIITHFKGIFTLPNLPRGRVNAVPPPQFFRRIGQEASGKAKSSQRVSEGKQHTEQKPPRELTPPMSAQSVNLVKKLDFSGEDIESSEALKYIGSGQKRKSGEMRKPTPTKMDIEEEKGASDKKSNKGYGEIKKEDIEEVEDSIHSIQYEKETKSTKNAPRGRKGNTKEKQEKGKGKGKGSASVSSAKESKQSEEKSVKESSQRSKSEKVVKGKTEKKESAPPSVRETRSRNTQIAQETQKDTAAKSDKTQKSEKTNKKQQESKKGKESKKEVEEEEENTRMTRSRGQKTKRKEEEVPKGKKVKMSK